MYVLLSRSHPESFETFPQSLWPRRGHKPLWRLGHVTWPEVIWGYNIHKVCGKDVRTAIQKSGAVFMPFMENPRGSKRPPTRAKINSSEKNGTVVKARTFDDAPGAKMSFHASNAKLAIVLNRNCSFIEKHKVALCSRGKLFCSYHPLCRNRLLDFQ